MTESRSTKYSREVESYVKSLNHATNSEVLKHLNSVFSDVSPTTTHRVTARLRDKGILASAPPKLDGCMRYDANTIPHDHFICDGCDGIRDLDIASELLPRINQALDGCRVTGRLVIYGKCENCADKGDKK